MFPYLRLGPFLLQMPLLALFIGFWIGNTFVEREAVRLGLNKEKINNLIGSGFSAQGWCTRRSMLQCIWRTRLVCFH